MRTPIEPLIIPRMETASKLRYITIPLCEATAPIQSYLKGELAALCGISRRSHANRYILFYLS